MTNRVTPGARALTTSMAVAGAFAAYDTINPTTQLASLAAFTTLATGVVFASNSISPLTQRAIDSASKGNRPMKYVLIGTSLGLAGYGTSRIAPPLLDLTAYVINNILKPLLIAGTVVTIGTLTLVVIARRDNPGPQGPTIVVDQRTVSLFGRN